MADPKQLKFSFVVDEASLQKTRQLIRELTSDLAKLNEQAQKAGGLGGFGGGGAGVNISAGGPKSAEAQKAVAKVSPVARPLVQNLQDQKQVIDNAAKGSRDAIKVMSDSLRQGVSQQKRELEQLEAAVKKLNQSYERLSGTAARLSGTKFGAAASADLQIMGGIVGNADVARRNARLRYDTTDPARRDELRAIYGETGPYYNVKDMDREIREERRAARQAARDEAGDGGIGLGRGLLKKLAPFGAAIGAAAILGNEVGNIRQSQQVFQAERNKIFAGAMGSMAGGDLTYGLALMRASTRAGPLGMDNAFNATGGLISKGSTGLSAVGTGIGNIVKSGASVVGIGSGPTGSGGIALGAWTPQGIGNANMAKAMNAIDVERAAITPLQQMALGGFSGSVGDRLQAQRILGLGGFGRDRNGIIGDPYGTLNASLMRQGFSVGELASATLGLRGMAGSRFAGANAHEAMRANALGYGGYDALMAAGQRAGIGADFARASIGGGIDTTAGIQLGSAIIGNGFDPRGTTTGLGVLGAAQVGMGFSGGATDFNLVQRAQLGMGLGDRVVGGGLDAYQRARNLVGAIRGNPGMGIYAQDYLANGMSFKQMLDMATGNSPLTATASALGLTGGSIAKQLKGSVGSVLDRFRDTGASDPMSQSIRQARAFMKGGHTLDEYFGSLKGSALDDARRNLGAFYGMQTGQGEEAGLGLMGLFSGVDGATSGSPRKGRMSGAGARGAEKEFLKGQADIQEQITKALTGLGDSVGMAASANAKAFAVMGTMAGSLDKSSSDFVAAINKMTAAINENLKRMNGGFKVTGK